MIFLLLSGDFYLMDILNLWQLLRMPFGPLKLRLILIFHVRDRARHVIPSLFWLISLLPNSLQNDKNQLHAQRTGQKSVERVSRHLPVFFGTEAMRKGLVLVPVELVDLFADEDLEVRL